MNTRANTDSKIVIVGAGIAGLKAASYLYKNGYTNLVIIEARDRIGGRLHTVPGLNGKYDLGASWHHDLLINTLFQEEQQLGKGKRGAEYVIEDDLVGLVNEDGERVDVDPELRLEPVAEEFDSYLNNVFNTRISKDSNLFHGLLAYLVENKQNLSSKQIQYMFGLGRYYELWHGVDWKNISSLDASGGHYGRNALVNGYEGIVNRIAKSVPLSEILRLNTSVKEINVLSLSKGVSIHGESPKRKVEIKLHGRGEKTIVADYVLVTVPLSLLKLSLDAKAANAKGVIAFNPPFQPRLQRAIDNISYGSLGKIVFEFNKVCWNTNKSRLVYLGKNQTELASLVTLHDSSTVTTELFNRVNKLTTTDNGIPDCKGFPYFVVNLPKSFDGMASLLFLCPEPITRHLETLNGNVDKLYEFLRPVLNSVLRSLQCKSEAVYHKDLGLYEEIPKTSPILKNIICTEWTKDPYARGAYTVVKPGDDLEGFVEEMKRGHEEVVRFAGEACVVTGNGCTWGATTSAVREANFIISDINKENRPCKL